MEIRCNMSKFCQSPGHERKPSVKAAVVMALFAIAYIIAGTFEYHAILGM